MTPDNRRHNVQLEWDRAQEALQETLQDIETLITAIAAVLTTHGYMKSD